MKIMVMSDTHGVLRPQVREMLEDCDAVIHCGDYHTQKVIDEIREAVRTDVLVYLVRGNNDGGWADHLPEHLEFTLDGVKFYVVHDKKDLPKDLGDSQIILAGHSHRYMEEWKDGRLYLNPGSCGRRRFRLDLTLAVLYLENRKISVERIDILDETGKHMGRMKKACKSAENGGTVNLPENLPEIIQNIMKRMDKGQRVDRISRELDLEQDFVEDICRIRVTHPGVGAEGILNKMEVNEKVRRRSDL